MAKDVLSLAMGALAVPANETVLLPDPALWFKVNVPVLAPAVWGVSLTVT